MRRALKKCAGVHIKTAGTTWLEELIGLAEAGGDGLEIASEFYARLSPVDELCGPYASVIDIDRAKLPGADTVNGWTATNSPPPCATTRKNRLQPQLPPIPPRRL